MNALEELGELLDHLQRTTRLSRLEAAHAVREVLAFFSESTETFVTRRHAELQEQELDNAQIYRRIAGELRARRVAPPELSERQIRRLIYG
jgi:hypothetical protein